MEILLKDLRIGNIINSLGKDGIWYKSVVSGLTNNEITVGVGIIPSDVKPIKISEQILFKCGFEKRGNTTLMDFYFEHLKFTINPQGSFYVCSEKVCYQILYLHQLQNLFYSLCGKELNVKL